MVQKRRAPIHTYEVVALCPNCDGGELVAFGPTYTSHPTQRDHKCNKCGHVERVYGGVSYPTIEYGPVKP